MVRQKVVKPTVNRAAYSVRVYNTDEMREETFTLMEGDHLPERYVEIGREPAGQCRTTCRMKSETV